VCRQCRFLDLLLLILALSPSEWRETAESNYWLRTPSLTLTTSGLSAIRDDASGTRKTMFVPNRENALWDTPVCQLCAGVCHAIQASK